MRTLLLALLTLAVAAPAALGQTRAPRLDASAAQPDPQKQLGAARAATGTEADLAVTWSGDPQWLVGVDLGGEGFGGGLLRGREFFGSSIGPDGDLPVEIVFSSALTTLAGVFRRTGGWQINNVGTFPGAVYDTSDPDNPRRLNVVFGEDPSAQVPDLSWNPDAGSDGGSEFLYIMASSYDGTGQTYAGNFVLFPPDEDVLYVLQSRLASGAAFLEADPASLTVDLARIAGLTAASTGQGSVELDWTYKAPPEAVELRLYTGFVSPAGTLLATLSPMAVSYTHAVTGFEPRHYRIEVLDDGGAVVDISREVSVRPSIALNAELLGRYDERSSYGDVWGWVDPATGREYALLTARFQGLSVIDLDAPTPTEVAFVPGLESPSIGGIADAKDVKTYGRFAYLAHEFAPVQIIDLAEPTAPVEVGQIDVQAGDFGGSHNILVEGDYLYVVGGRSPGGLRIYDLAADPVAPPLVGEINGTDGQTYYHDLEVVGDLAYAAAIYDQGIDVLDLSDRTAPEVLTTIVYPAASMGAHNVCATPDGRTIFVGDEIGSGRWTRAFDVSNLEDPELIAEVIVDPNAVVHNCYVRGTSLYVAHYTEGLQVFDVRDPSQPRQVAFYDTYAPSGFGFNGAWTAYPYLPSGRVIVSDLSGGLFVIGVGLEAVSLTAEVTSPLTVAPGGALSFDYTVTNGTSAAVTGDLFFTAERGGRVVAQGVIQSGTLPAGQSVSGSFAQQVPSSAPAGTYAYSIKLGAFPSAERDAVPLTVTVTGAALGAGTPGEWTVADATAWPAAEAASAPASRLPGVSAFPNPLGAATTLRFALAEAGHARLAVYDVLGREVAVLADGPHEAGPHELQLDARALPNGAYIVRLSTAQYTETQQITVLR